VSIFTMKKRRQSGEENPKPPLAVIVIVVDSPVFVHVVALLLSFDRRRYGRRSIFSVKRL
jgi:hypothetical protein